MRLTTSSISILLLSLVLLALAPVAGARPAGGAADEESALPSRVANAIGRTELALDSAARSIGSRELTKAVASLGAVRFGLADADKAARRQMRAKPSEDSETAPGPDAVVAVLTLDQEAVTTIAGLFNRRTGVLVQNLSTALAAALNLRDRLLASVTKLNPEGAGADYSDGMADSVTGYDDEVANLSEALADDVLSPAARTALTGGLARAKAARSRVTKAFGGGE